MNPTLFWRVALAAALSFTLAACGGGGADGGTGGTGISIGVMTKGSTIVGGVRFEDTTANITIDDTPKTASIDLRDGMVVKVLGTVNADGVTGTAQRIEAQIEVRGLAGFDTSTPPNLVVLGQTVLADDQTVYSNLLNFAAITTGMLIEVHGLRDTSNRIRATRIEANTTQMGDDTVDEIRGVVTNGTGTNPATFRLGIQDVAVTGGLTILPAGATYQNGSVVEVHCVRPCVSGGVFQASRIEVEDAEDAAFQAGAGQRMEAEGLVSGFAIHPGDFFVNSVPVRTSVGTRFEGGIATDLGNDIKVEAEGSWDGSRLLATKIEFKRSVVRLQGNVTVSGPSSFTMSIASNSVNIETDILTSGSIPPVGPGCVQVRGQRKLPATPLVVIAGEIDPSCSSSGRHFMQAPVEAESPETTITLLGFVLNVSAPTDTPPYKDVNEAGLTRTAFFNAVSPAGTNAAGLPVPGTLVKVIFDTGGPSPNAVRQVEIED